jgi:hypothetical protein
VSRSYFEGNFEMEFGLSSPLRTLPSFLSTISMVVDDQSAIIKSLTHAERKSPPKYAPTRDLFFRVLKGDLSFSQALKQASLLPDQVQKECAVEVLEAAKDFLRDAPKGVVTEFPLMQVQIPNELALDVSPVWLQHLDPKKLLVLHFWRRPLADRQRSAAATILRRALLQQQPFFSGCELDFVSVSVPTNGSSRKLRLYDWKGLKPLDERDLVRFWQPLVEAWSKYQSREPRRFRRRGERGLFDRPY